MTDDGLLIECSGLTVAFGGVVAVNDVSFSVARGELLGLIGPNGAGKTSLLNAVSGVVRLSSGRVVLDGTDITDVPLHRRVGLGIARTFQGVELLPDLTVLENLMLGRHHLMRSNAITGGVWFGPARREERSHRRRVDEIIGMLDLGDVRGVPATSLSLGRQKVVAIARALCAEPQLLLLDEPASGLNREERERLAELLLRLKGDLGVTTIWIEHDVRMIVELADRVMALYYGRKIGEGAAADVLALAEVRTAFLGSVEHEAA
jgi:branched-chain amino acid transport system ATP-binding protein